MILWILSSVLSLSLLFPPLLAWACAAASAILLRRGVFLFHCLSWLFIGLCMAHGILADQSTRGPTDLSVLVLLTQHRVRRVWRCGMRRYVFTPARLLSPFSVWASPSHLEQLHFIQQKKRWFWMPSFIWALNTSLQTVQRYTDNSTNFVYVFMEDKQTGLTGLCNPCAREAFSIQGGNCDLVLVCDNMGSNVGQMATLKRKA